MLCLLDRLEIKLYQITKQIRSMLVFDEREKNWNLSELSIEITNNSVMVLNLTLENIVKRGCHRFANIHANSL